MPVCVVLHPWTCPVSNLFVFGLFNHSCQTVTRECCPLSEYLRLRSAGEQSQWASRVFVESSRGGASSSWYLVQCQGPCTCQGRTSLVRRKASCLLLTLSWPKPLSTSAGYVAETCRMKASSRAVLPSYSPMPLDEGALTEASLPSVNVIHHVCSSAAACALP